MALIFTISQIISMVNAGLTTTAQAIETAKAAKAKITEDGSDVSAPGMTVDELEERFASARAAGLLTGDNAADRLINRNKD